MASYFDEHPHASEDAPRVNRAEEGLDSYLGFARMLVEGGWVDDLDNAYETVTENGKATHPDAIKKLTVVNAEDLPNQDDQCLICLEKWADADEREKVTKLPCKHLFHTNCILVWLKKNSCCPACRHELPAVDPLYDEWRKQQKRKDVRKADLEELHNSMFS